MADESLELLIKTTADTSGADKTKIKLVELSASLNSIKKTVPAHEEAGKAAEKHAEHAHALHKVFHKLNEVLRPRQFVPSCIFADGGADVWCRDILVDGRSCRRWQRHKPRSKRRYGRRSGKECSKPKKQLTSMLPRCGT
jgi:hypothetical protein